MPIRRAVNSKKETVPKNRPAEPEPEQKKDAEVSSEESASTGEEQETETPPATSSEAEQAKEPEPEAGEEKEDGKPSEETKKDGKDPSEKKEKKVKKTIPIWATLSDKQLARAQKVTHSVASSRPKMDTVLMEAIKACFHKGGASVVAIRKYIINKYPSLDLESRGYLLKQALKRELQRGRIRQLTGKGASGSFVAVPNAGKPAQKLKGDRKKSSSPAATEQQNVKLEDILPLAFTRICEPKEASYGLIKKYVSQYYPKLKVDVRPQILKNALQRAVDKGQLEQITGKGATGTFQLKRSVDKPLLGGSMLEDAILSAITAMNEPKTCSTSAIKKYVLERHPGTNSNFQVHMLKRTLHKCEQYGWLEQITGKGFSGTYRLSFPYYPNPDILFPDKRQEEESSSEDEDSEEESDEEESSSEEESEEDEPPPKKRLQKKGYRGRAIAPLRQANKPKPKRGPPKVRGNIKSTPKKAPPPSPKKAKPAPPPAKKIKVPPTPDKKTKVPPTPDKKTKVPPTPDKKTKVPPTPDKKTKVPPTPDKKTKVPPTPDKKNKVPTTPDKKNKVPTTPAKKARPSPPPAKKPAGSSPKKPASEKVKPSPKGKSTNRKSVRGK